MRRVIKFASAYADLKGLQLLVKSLYGQSYYIKVATFNLLNGYDANPLLNAIGSSLIKGQVVVNIKVDFLICNFGKLYLACYTKVFDAIGC